MTTTVARETAEAEPKICAMTYAGFAAMGIALHVVHEVFAEGSWAAAPVAVATLALSVLWPVVGRKARRAGATVFGLLWIGAAGSGHLAPALGGAAAAIHYTGLLAVAGGALLVVAAVADVRHPVVWERGQR